MVNCTFYKHGSIITEDLIVCAGVPSVSALLLLSVLCCCIGVHVHRRRKRARRELSGRDRNVDTGTLEMKAPIDLATGQLNQQETTMSSKDEMLIDKNKGAQEVDKPYLSKKTDSLSQEMDKQQAPMATLERTISKSHDQTTSLSTADKNPTSLLDSAKSTKLLPTSDNNSSDTTVKKTNVYEGVQRKEEISPQEGETDSQPVYHDVGTKLEASGSMQKKAISPEEHKYHTLCGLIDEKKDLLTSHHYENKEGGLSLTPSKSRPAAPLPGQPLPGQPLPGQPLPGQSRKHDYEEVDSKQASTHGESPQEKYSVLSNQMEMNPLQSGVVQEDLTESPTEDRYYSTTRVHRLVPLGKPIGQPVTDHMYQALDEHNPRRQHSKDYDQVQSRHNTFGATPNYQRSNENLLRTYSSTAQSLEKLDPMYDEPYKLHERSSSLQRVDIYNVDNLFDDPKYGVKSSESANMEKVFDDPTYMKGTAGSGEQRDPQSDSQARSETRHVSFSAETKTGVQYKTSKEKISSWGARKSSQ